MPYTSAGAIFHAGMPIGKLNGVITPITPTGRRTTRIRSPGLAEAYTSPCSRFASFAKKRRMFGGVARPRRCPRRGACPLRGRARCRVLRCPVDERRRALQHRGTLGDRRARPAGCGPREPRRPRHRPARGPAAAPTATSSSGRLGFSSRIGGPEPSTKLLDEIRQCDSHVSSSYWWGRSSEGFEARDVPAEYKGVHLVCALVGTHRLEVVGVAQRRVLS